MLWIIIPGAYVLIGVIIVLLPAVRRTMRILNAVIPPPRDTLWQAVAFFVLAYAAIIMVWPLLLWGLVPHRDRSVLPISPTKPEPEIPAEWLIRPLTEDEAAKSIWFASNIPADGCQLWELRSPDHYWKNLAGRTGIALVCNGKVVASQITMMN
jgi:hypothetical protein